VLNYFVYYIIKNKMNAKVFILMMLFSYLRFVSGQYQYSQLYSYYNSPNDYQYPLYSIPYYSSYVTPTYYYQYPGLPNTTNSSTYSPIVQRSSSIINNITNFINIYTIVFIGMVIDMIINV